MRCARSAPGSTSSTRSSALDGELESFGVSIDVRIGINTGLVVVGDIGTGEFRDEMAVVGETPNVAARLQGLAEPGTVVVGERTRRLVEGLFTFEERGPQSSRASRSRSSFYRVREPTGATSRFEATARRGLTPLVGRDEEIRLLLSRWEGAKAGEGHVVLLDRRARHRQVAHRAVVPRARRAPTMRPCCATTARRSTSTARCIRSSTSSSARPA